MTSPELVELVIGQPAHGGSCVARADDGRVVFVRHALPGERVLARVTAERSHFLRADAVEVLEASPERVAAPCPYAGPGRCGGCDLQHASRPAQLAWKAAVVREQLVKLAGLDVEVTVEPLPDVPAADGPGLGWRTRVTYSVDRAQRTGLLAHASHRVVPIDRCRIAHPDVAATDVAGAHGRRARSIEVVAASGRRRVTTVDQHGHRRVEGPLALTERAAGHEFTVHGFWQVHPAAADTLAAAVLGLLVPQPGEQALDLYAGAGLFAFVLADAGCSVIAVESGHRAARDAVANCAGLPVEVWDGGVAEALAERPAADVVVLDPPRAGAGPAVVAGIAALAPRAVAYVACDPAVLARDLATFAEHGYRVVSLRGFDCFPMTHHVECVALLGPV